MKHQKLYDLIKSAHAIVIGEDEAYHVTAVIDAIEPGYVDTEWSVYCTEVDGMNDDVTIQLDEIVENVNKGTFECYSLKAEPSGIYLLD